MSSGGPARLDPLEARRLLSAALLKDINPSTGDSSPGNMIDVNGTLYFSAYTPATGRELFKSDGTATGTVLVKDIIPGDNGSAPSGLAATADGTVFFSASRPTANGSQDRELWKTDGTAGGTVLVRDISPSVINGSTPALLTAVGNTLYFIANDDVHGVELWKSDGTEAGTVLVKDVAPGIASPMIIELIAFGGNLYFLAAAEGGAFQVWRSDGTEAGTSVFHPGPAGTSLEIAGGLLYFTAYDEQHGSEVWRTDGTEAGTFPLDMRPGSDGAAPLNLTDAGDGTLVFTASPDAGGQELWRTDGTPEGTVRVTDMNGPGRPAVVVSDVSTAGDAVVFKSTNDDLYRVGATPGSEVNLGHFPTAFNMNLAQSGNGDYVLFASEDAAANTMTLHRSDGTAAGTVALRVDGPDDDLEREAVPRRCRARGPRPGTRHRAVGERRHPRGHAAAGRREPGAGRIAADVPRGFVATLGASGAAASGRNGAAPRLRRARPDRQRGRLGHRRHAGRHGQALRGGAARAGDRLGNGRAAGAVRDGGDPADRQARRNQRHAAGHAPVRR